MTWKVTTKPIKNLSNTVNKKLITGDLKNMRFDVGAITYVVNPCPPVYNVPLFNQILRGNVKIVKTGDKTYKINFRKTSEITFYQVWSVNNNSREVYSSNVFNWTNYIRLNAPFSPTTVMEFGNCRYAFIITGVEYLEKNKMIWNVSQKEIANLSTVFTNDLKTGNFKDARFDVDSISTAGTYYSSITIPVSNCSVTYSDGSVYNGTVTISPYQNNCMSFVYDTIPNPTDTGVISISLTFNNSTFSFNNTTFNVLSSFEGDWFRTGYFQYTNNLPSNIKEIQINQSVLSQLENKNNCYSTFTGNLGFPGTSVTITGLLCFCQSSNQYILYNLVTSTSDPNYSQNFWSGGVYPGNQNLIFQKSCYPQSYVTSTFIVFEVYVNLNYTTFYKWYLGLNKPSSIPNCQTICPTC